MRIDERVEERVRDTLHWVVRRDESRVDASLRSYPDVATRTSALELLGAISIVILVEACGGTPTPQQVWEVAEAVAEMERWSGLSADEVATFLTALLNRQQIDQVLPPEDAVVLAFVVAGSLLASRSKAEEGKRWFNYLDQVEAVIEAAPSPPP
jgi:hypothetical protein